MKKIVSSIILASVCWGAVAQSVPEQPSAAPVLQSSIQSEAPEELGRVQKDASAIAGTEEPKPQAVPSQVKQIETKISGLQQEVKKSQTEQKDLLENINYTWVLLCAILVFFMQAGFALIESGSTRSKNMVNVMMKNYMDMAVGSVAFALVGFGLMFGVGNGWLGLSHFGLVNFTNDEYVFFFFQLMFATTAATIVSGAISERTRFVGYLIGALILCAFTYPIFGAWAWGSLDAGAPGWLKSLGYIDFAGSSVVHVVGGFSALAATIIVGPRLGRFGRGGKVFPIAGHNASLMVLGTFILWFGWFGFNGGSLLAANESLGLILINTHLAACAGALGVMLMHKVRGEKVLMSMLLNGGLAGLVGITAGAATMNPLFAFITGLIAGVLMFAASSYLLSKKIDDVVNAFPVHGVCGVWGTLAAGLFLKGNMFSLSVVGVQLLGVTVCVLWAFCVSYVVYALLKSAGLLRVTSEDERSGLDYTEHAELGYPEFQKDVLFVEESK